MDTIDESRLWIESLPRERLGSFAVDFEQLVMMESTIRVEALNKDWIGTKVPSTYWAGVPYEQMNIIITETYFWYLKSDNPKLVRYGEDFLDTLAFSPNGQQVQRVWLERFRLIYHNPAALTYFEAGIWDMDVIQKMISDGVDAALAANTLGIV